MQFVIDLGPPIHISFAHTATSEDYRWFCLQNANVSTWVKYTFSLYRSVAQMIGTGYGLHAPPTTLPEVWIAIISYMLGGIFYALFIAHMSTLIFIWNLPVKQYEQKVCSVS